MDTGNNDLAALIKSLERVSLVDIPTTDISIKRIDNKITSGPST